MASFRPILLVASLLLAGCPAPVSGAPSMEQVRTTLRANFYAFDTNQDDLLSMGEALVGVPGMSSGQFNQLDTNQDGLLSDAEAGLVGPGDHDPDGCICGGGGEGEVTLPRHFTYRVLDTFPHDSGAFTQGLVIEDGTLYEGTGLYGSSTLRRVSLATGNVEQKIDLNAAYFGEGIVVWEDTIIQLTWRARKGFIYDRESFAMTGEFTYASEGWGITHNGTELIMSDGTDVIRFLDPETFSILREITVLDEGEPVRRLNELEYIHGKVWANVWQTDLIAQIDPASGQVVGWIDLSGLLTPAQEVGADVLNGIAFDQSTGQIIVTGKRWPSLFQIALVPTP